MNEEAPEIFPEKSIYQVARKIICDLRRSERHAFLRPDFRHYTSGEQPSGNSSNGLAKRPVVRRTRHKVTGLQGLRAEGPLKSRLSPCRHTFLELTPVFTGFHSLTGPIRYAVPTSKRCGCLAHSLRICQNVSQALEPKNTGPYRAETLKFGASVDFSGLSALRPCNPVTLCRVLRTKSTGFLVPISQTRNGTRRITSIISLDLLLSL